MQRVDAEEAAARLDRQLQVSPGRGVETSATGFVRATRMRHIYHLARRHFLSARCATLAACHASWGVSLADLEEQSEEFARARSHSAYRATAVSADFDAVAPPIVQY